MRMLHGLLTLCLLLAPTPLAAQHTDHVAHGSAATSRAVDEPIPADAVVGTIVLAHGAGPDWNALVEQVVAQVNTGGPVAVSYLMGPAAKDHRFQDVVARLAAQGADHVVVVPMLMSSYSGHYEQIRYLAGLTDQLSDVMTHHLHMAGIERADADVPVHVARAIDDSPDVARVLAERALALTGQPARHALFIMGHGPNSAEDNAMWMQNLRAVADTVARLTDFRDVRVGLVRDDAPAPVRAEAVRHVREMIELQHEITDRDVIVVPALISTGAVSLETFPADLAGLPIVYTGEALLPHPGLARWIEARVADLRAE